MNARTVLLVVSLCVNVVFIAIIGVGVGRALDRRPPGFSPQVILREVPQADRARVERIFAAHRSALREARMAARRARVDAFRTFIAPDFTPTAFAGSLATVRAADALLENESIATLGDVVASLTPAEREEVVARMRHRRPWERLLAPPRDR